VHETIRRWCQNYDRRFQTLDQVAFKPGDIVPPCYGCGSRRRLVDAYSVETLALTWRHNIAVARDEVGNILAIVNSNNTYIARRAYILVWCMTLLPR
jgi:hypothetical protein